MSQYNADEPVMIEFGMNLAHTRPTEKSDKFLENLEDGQILFNLIRKYGETTILEAISGFLFSHLEQISDFTEEKQSETLNQFERGIVEASEQSALLIYAAAQAVENLTNKALGRESHGVVGVVSDVRI